MAVAALVVVGVGLVMVVTGVVISVVDWRQKNAEAKNQAMRTHALGLAEDLNALRKLVIVLKSQPLGEKLIVYGIVVMVIGGILGGVAALN
jgi:hypothetical protein